MRRAVKNAEVVLTAVIGIPWASAAGSRRRRLCSVEGVDGGERDAGVLDELPIAQPVPVP
jgi:hypothetical protein